MRPCHTPIHCSSCPLSHSILKPVHLEITGPLLEAQSYTSPGVAIKDQAANHIHHLSPTAQHGGRSGSRSLLRQLRPTLQPPDPPTNDSSHPAARLNTIALPAHHPRYVPHCHSYPPANDEPAAQARALAALTPSRAARTAPSPARLACALARAALPPATVALAACLLDALSGAFARSWRAAALAPRHRRGGRRNTRSSRADEGGVPATPPCDGAAAAGAEDDERVVCRGGGEGACGPRCAGQQQQQQQHREQLPRQQEQDPRLEDDDDDHDACACRARAPPPETVALAALKIAAGFLEDRRVDSSRWWTGGGLLVADARVDARDVDLAVRCILVDVDYDLCAFSAEEVEKRRVWMMRGVEEEEQEGGWLEVAPAVAA